MMSNPLLPTTQVPDQEPERPIQLICLPHAGGGSAAYFRWRTLTPDWLAVTPIQLPGREARIHDPLYATLAELVQDVANAVAPLTDQTYALLGNSMGAIVAFELARELRRRELPLPKMLIVAACRAPQLMKPPAKPLSELDDEQFVSEMNEQYGGIPEEISKNRELLQLLLPVLRADMAMLETYQYDDEEPLNLELLALGGNEDATVSVTDINAWRVQTNGRFSARMNSGGHFFFTDASAQTPPAALKTTLKRLQEYR